MELLRAVRELSKRQEEIEVAAKKHADAQLQAQLDSALGELEELRRGREAQEEMVTTIVRQRDVYKSMVAQLTREAEERRRDPSAQLGGPAIVPTTPIRTPVRTPVREEPAFNQDLQRDLEILRQESKETEATLARQLEESRQAASALRISNEKAQAEIAFLAERLRLVTENAASERKETLSHIERSATLSAQLLQHQQLLHEKVLEDAAKEERLKRANADLAALRLQLSAAQQSEDSLRAQLAQGAQERARHAALLDTLQEMQQSMERADRNVKQGLAVRVETLEQECANLRTAAEQARTQQAEALERHTFVLEDARSKLAAKSEEVSSLAQRVFVLDREREAFKEKVAQLESTIATQQQKLEIYQAPAPTEIAPTTSTESELRSLQLQIGNLKIELEAAQQQARDNEQHTERFKAIAHANEEALLALRADYERVLRDSEQQTVALRSEKENLEREFQEVQQREIATAAALESEKAKLTESRADFEQQIAKLKLDIAAQSEDVQHAERRVKAVLEEAQKHREESVLSRELYEREVVQHANAVQSISKIKEELREARIELEKSVGQNSRALAAAEEAQRTLMTERISRTQERTEMEAKMRDIEEQNMLLHKHLDSLSHTAARIQNSQSILSRSETQVTETATQSSPQDELRQVIGYLRREKEIVETKLQLAHQEASRYKHQYEHALRQNQEMHTQFNEERERLKANLVSESEHRNTLMQLERLHLLQESNVTLREESARHRKHAEEAESKIIELSNTLAPVQDENRQLKATEKALRGEVEFLKKEISEWRSRVQGLTEKYQRVDVNEYITLNATVDSLRAEVAAHQRVMDDVTLTHQRALDDVTLTHQKNR
eukprot:TRINITY_DN2985_c0_g1_i2.p1 TRINITY_DN2985_c0_g1~~TRINITY_DN2985_c0_g1_i2.p1  ORF type:complete len:851 (-),score=265.51 TRINITY_DN2985_c0_g1_i2:1668-4220(-)